MFRGELGRRVAAAAAIGVLAVGGASACQRGFDGATSSSTPPATGSTDGPRAGETPVPGGSPDNCPVTIVYKPLRGGGGLFPQKGIACEIRRGLDQSVPTPTPGPAGR